MKNQKKTKQAIQQDKPRGTIGRSKYSLKFENRKREARNLGVPALYPLINMERENRAEEASNASNE